jgi:FMN-dependent NADH-azoreductase
MKLLHIDSSISGGPSASRQLSAEAVNSLRYARPGLEIVRRDLELDPLPHYDSKMLAASWPENQADDATRDEIAKNAAVLDEFLSADIIVIGAPMYNFAIPSQLKAWIDRIVIAGRTFRYGQSGVEGLATGKKVIVASSRGGLYGNGTPQAAFDFQETYLRAILGFIGIDDIEFIRAEGLALGPEPRQEAIRAGFQAARTAAHRVAHSLNAQDGQHESVHKAQRVA